MPNMVDSLVTFSTYLATIASTLGCEELSSCVRNDRQNAS